MRNSQNIFRMLLALTLSVPTAAGAIDDGSARDPATAVDVLAVAKQMLDDKVIAQDSLYSEDEIARRFGPTAQIALEGAADHAPPTAWVIVFGESQETTAPRNSSVSGPPVGIRVHFGKYVELHRAGTDPLICFMDVSFHQARTRPDFDSVVERLGPDWVEDFDAERERFLAVTREPWNPPFPRATVPMGNAVIRYGEGSKRLELDFDPSGVLLEAHNTRAPC